MALRYIDANILAPIHVGAETFWLERLGTDTFWRKDGVALIRFGAKTIWRRVLLAPNHCFTVKEVMLFQMELTQFLYDTACIIFCVTTVKAAEIGRRILCYLGHQVPAKAFRIYGLSQNSLFNCVFRRL